MKRKAPTELDNPAKKLKTYIEKPELEALVAEGRFDEIYEKLLLEREIDTKKYSCNQD